MEVGRRRRRHCYMVQERSVLRRYGIMEWATAIFIDEKRDVKVLMLCAL